MRVVIVFEQGGNRLKDYPVQVATEGDLQYHISEVCGRFRRDTGKSLLDGILIRIEREN